MGFTLFRGSKYVNRCLRNSPYGYIYEREENVENGLSYNFGTVTMLPSTVTAHHSLMKDTEKKKERGRD